MRRGEVYWCFLPPPIGRRPVLILTRDSALGYLADVIVAEATTTIRKTPAEVLVDENDGMPQACVLNLHHIHAVRKTILESRITTLPEAKIREVESALCWALGMDRLLFS